MQFLVRFGVILLAGLFLGVLMGLRESCVNTVARAVLASVGAGGAACIVLLGFGATRR